MIGDNVKKFRKEKRFT